MSLLAQIKAKQLAEAAENGENPYAVCQALAVSAPLLPNPELEPVVVSQVSHSILAEIKSKQIEAGELDGYTPYFIGIDIGSGQDKTVIYHGDLAHYQAAMDADLATLSPIKDLVEKAVVKKRMIETYWGFVKAYMDNGDNYPNSVAVRVMIWLFDTLDIERGLELAFNLIKQGIHVTPAKFDRDLPTFVCDAVYDWAAALLKLDPQQSASPYLDALVATLDNDKWSLAPPVQSKMYAMLGKHKARVGEYATVVALCDKAEAVNPEGHGTKGLKAGALAKLKEQSKDE